MVVSAQDKPVQAQDRRRVLFRVPGAANLPRGWSISVVGEHAAHCKGA